MTRSLICMIAAVLFLIFADAGFAQTDVVLTLEKSIETALQQNPEIRIAEKEFKKSGASVWEAYAAVLPQLDASANFQHAWEIQESTIPNFVKTMMGPAAPPGMPDFVRISFALENSLTYGATLKQPLFLGGAGFAGIQSAYAGKQAMNYNLESKRQNLVFQTANAFYTCLLTRELITVKEEALDQAKANYDVVQKKYEVGSASGFDRMRAQVDVANLQPPVISARNDYKSALTRLKTILGMDKEAEIKVAGQFVFVPDEFDEMPLSGLQEMALQNRPELQAMAQQKKISQKGITIARSNFLPKLYFSTDYSYMANRNDLKFSQDDFSKGFTSALSLQIPLFHGFRNAKQYQKARLDYKIVRDSEKQTRDNILAEVEVAYNKFREAKEKYQSARETVDLAEESLRLANLMYDEGSNTQLDVLNTRLALTQARMNYVSSLYEYQVSRYELRRVTGRLHGVL